MSDLVQTSLETKRERAARLHMENNHRYTLRHPDRIKARNRHFVSKRREALAGFKVNGCAICGYNKCKSALDFHHANPEDKVASISAMVNRTYGCINEEIVDELSKCILLCRNCHAEIEEMEQKG